VIEDLPVEAVDLSRVRPTAPRALGQLIRITGRVLGHDGRPVDGAVLEIWQANAAGKYVHDLDPSPAPIDPNFLGTGRVRTDGRGRFSLLTIKPGAYPVPYEERGGADDWWRPPHVHFSIFGPGFADRLVTQMYFPGEPLNQRDLLLSSIPDPAARRRMIAVMDQDLRSAQSEALVFHHDFVLAGTRPTPFEDR
jgi:protocatechuate 3,4-dioxygenase beta subunit